MPVKRNIIIPAILALSTAGSVLAGSATILVTQAPAAVAATSTVKQPDFLYHG
jgi:hypothetical protein